MQLFAAVQPFSADYKADWDSLAQHNAEPEWLKDAKLGIYFHWGPYSVPAYSSEWYPRQMFQGGHVTRFHEKEFGPLNEFGYHHFVPMFKAEKFDAEEWADLFQKAGAKFAGPVAEHHDGFSMWASQVTPWNAKDMGPKRDILGDLFASLEKREMKTIATFHHARNLQRYADSWETESKRNGRKFNNSHYPYIPGGFTASDDPQLRLLYGNVPEEEWLETIWLGKLKEVIDQYHPDIIWFDSWLDRIPENYLQQFCAYYLNAANGWDKEVVIAHKHKDLPSSVSMIDLEKSREPTARNYLWMTDDTISTGSWCFTRDLKIKPLHKVVHALVDTTSKNGVVLLNISPKADGSIPDDQRQVLLGLGAWLKRNGEAIYGTRPWITAAEGPTAEPKGGFADHGKFLKLEYSAKDVRYTASKDGKTLYATTLGIPPKDSELLLKSVTPKKVAVLNVSLIDGTPVDWTQSEQGLQLKAPATKETSALPFKIQLK